MNGWSAKDISLSTDPAIAGVVTNQVVSLEGWPITAGGALNFVAKIAVSGVTVVGSITAKLQTAIGDDWEDSKTVTVTTNDAYYIKLNVQDSGDWQYLPLLNKGRIVLTTTNAGDAVTVDSVNILQEL